MWRLPKPTDKPGDVYLTCISKVQNSDLKKRLLLCELEVIHSSQEFEKKASSTQLHLITPMNDINGIVTKEEMIKVYTDRMVNKKAPGRLFYEKILSSSPHQRCPLCGQRVVSTLDHHLPKAHYPVFSVIPYNLIPACTDCNKAKKESIPTKADQVTIHPYFDDIESERWLYARVIETTPPVIEFYTEPPKSWSDLLGKRVKWHFETLGLAKLYASNSADELANIEYSLEKLYASGGYNAVKIHLIDMAKSRLANHTNSWQSAMYESLSDSHWFCNAGFRFLN